MLLVPQGRPDLPRTLRSAHCAHAVARFPAHGSSFKMNPGPVLPTEGPGRLNVGSKMNSVGRESPFHNLELGGFTNCKSHAFMVCGWTGGAAVDACCTCDQTGDSIRNEHLLSQITVRKMHYAARKTCQLFLLWVLRP